MLRRDFMKFAGALGLTLGLPAAKPRPTWATAQFPDGEVVVQNGDALKVTYKPQPDVVMTFSFGNERVTIEANEGQLNYQEKLGFIGWRVEEGELIGATGPVSYDFDLDFVAETLTDRDFLTKLKGSKSFDLDVTIDGFTYHLRECVWRTLEHDFSNGLFAIGGSAPYGDVHNE